MQINNPEQKHMSRSLSNSGDTGHISRPSIKVDVPDIVSVSACADLTLPPGAGLCIDTVHGPVFLVNILLAFTVLISFFLYSEKRKTLCSVKPFHTCFYYRTKVFLFILRITNAMFHITKNSVRDSLSFYLLLNSFLLFIAGNQFFLLLPVSP